MAARALLRRFAIVTVIPVVPPARGGLGSPQQCPDRGRGEDGDGSRFHRDQCSILRSPGGTHGSFWDWGHAVPGHSCIKIRGIPITLLDAFAALRASFPCDWHRICAPSGLIQLSGLLKEAGERGHISGPGFTPFLPSVLPAPSPLSSRVFLPAPGQSCTSGGVVETPGPDPHTRVFFLFR